MRNLRPQERKEKDRLKVHIGKRSRNLQAMGKKKRDRRLCRGLTNEARKKGERKKSEKKKAVCATAGKGNWWLQCS